MYILFFTPQRNNKKIILAKHVVWVLKQAIKLLLPDAFDSNQESLDSWGSLLWLYPSCVWTSYVWGPGLDVLHPFSLQLLVQNEEHFFFFCCFEQHVSASTIWWWSRLLWKSESVSCAVPPQTPPTHAICFLLPWANSHLLDAIRFGRILAWGSEIWNYTGCGTWPLSLSSSLYCLWKCGCAWKYGFRFVSLMVGTNCFSLTLTRSLWFIGCISIRRNLFRACVPKWCYSSIAVIQDKPFQ